MDLAGFTMKTIRDPSLEQYLTERDISWAVIPPDHHVALAAEWDALYGEFRVLGMRYQHGSRAEHAYANESADSFLIVPFLGIRGLGHDMKRSGAPAAYECRGTHDLPDLSGFKDKEFFLVPPDFGWSMI